ncbi:hypothetical protein LAUMK35_04749 [Mycobacterium pseudokansasii]|uniref:Uncharacterized protein n=1 Tax=Mycobacterium pseudokansasii TaxID=2341080 RepID=A0A498R2N6_9MYCO|nr:hypothetical protein LAUMK35_04749 [Mycobacterium pseudokansasii]VBA32218.1 hypothetical protein LAUMK21_04742 [Mycobacterium pseudokansasii]VBA54421.1 hypothetical protein LAUMK142_04646 [Mycobacterium pseudokansasii]
MKIHPDSTFRYPILLIVVDQRATFDGALLVAGSGDIHLCLAVRIPPRNHLLIVILKDLVVYLFSTARLECCLLASVARFRTSGYRSGA